MWKNSLCRLTSGGHRSYPDNAVRASKFIGGNFFSADFAHAYTFYPIDCNIESVAARRFNDFLSQGQRWILLDKSLGNTDGSFCSFNSNSRRCLIRLAINTHFQLAAVHHTSDKSGIISEHFSASDQSVRLQLWHPDPEEHRPEVRNGHFAPQR